MDVIVVLKCRIDSVLLVPSYRTPVIKHYNAFSAMGVIHHTIHISVIKAYLSEVCSEHTSRGVVLNNKLSATNQGKLQVV